MEGGSLDYEFRDCLGYAIRYLAELGGVVVIGYKLATTVPLDVPIGFVEFRGRLICSQGCVSGSIYRTVKGALYSFIYRPS